MSANPMNNRLFWSPFHIFDFCKSLNLASLVMKNSKFSHFIRIFLPIWRKRGVTAGGFGSGKFPMPLILLCFVWWSFAWLALAESRCFFQHGGVQSLGDKSFNFRQTWTQMELYAVDADANIIFSLTNWKLLLLDTIKKCPRTHFSVRNIWNFINNVLESMNYLYRITRM